MVGCHHWLNGREFEQAPGVGEGQGSLACHNPWDRRVGHDIVTELMGSEVTVPKKQKPRPKGQPSTCPLGSWHFVFFAISLLVQFSCVHLFSTPWTAARQASLSFTISWSLLKLTSIESVMSSNYLILCHPPLLLPSVFPSIRVFSDESVLRIRWPKYWSFSTSASVLPVNVQS